MTLEKVDIYRSKKGTIANFKKKRKRMGVWGVAMYARDEDKKLSKFLIQIH